MTAKSKKTLNLIVIALCVIMLATCVTFATISAFAVSGNASAYDNTNKPASTIGSLTFDDYDTRTGSDPKVFNGAALTKLYSAIVNAVKGTSVTNATYDDAKAAVTNSQSTVIGKLGSGDTPWTQNKSADFTKLSSKGVLTLSFGGLDWVVVYATTNVTNDPSTSKYATDAGDLVITLWLADNYPNMTSTWNNYSSDTTNVTYPSDMYSTSYIRVQTLNGGGDAGAKFAKDVSNLGTMPTNRQNHTFAAFTMSENTTSGVGQRSLTRFLTQPKYVKYQEEENWVWSYTGTGNPYLLPNEAWGSPDTTVTWHTGGWYGGSGGKHEIYRVHQKTNYSDWSSDYLWLPSLTETGYWYSKTEHGSSLWGIPTTTNAESYTSLDPVVTSTLPSGASAGSWLRSGVTADATYATGLLAAGTFLSSTVPTVGAVRPALHLNLKSAALSAATEYDNPEDFDYVYNNKGVAMKQLYADLVASGASAKVGWYDEAVYEGSALNQRIMLITHYNSANQVVQSLKNAGEYWIKFTINPSYISEISSAKLPMVQFTGIPDTSDPQHLETDTVRWIKVTITQLEIGIDTSQYRQDPNTGLPIPPVVNSATNAKYTQLGIDPTAQPVLGWEYEDDSTGQKYATPPRVGNYTARPVILDANGTPLNINEGNFKIDNAQNYSYDVYISVAGLPVPTLSVSSVAYDGTKKHFVINGYDPNTMTINVDSRLDEEAKDKEYSAINAGKYTVSFSVISPYEWESGGTASRTLTFEITPMDVAASFSSVTLGASDWKWEKGSAPANGDISLSVSDPLALGDIEVYYLLDTSSIKHTITDLANFDWSSLQIGNYTLYAEIPAGSSNFGLAGVCQKKIEVQSVAVDPSTLVYNWLHNGSSIANPINFTVTYNASAHTITLDSTNLLSQGVKIDVSYNTNGYTNGYKNQSFTDASTLSSSTYIPYKTEVRIVPLNGYRFSTGLDSATASFNWTIERATLDLSKLVWNESIFAYDGTVHEVYLTGVPAGVTVRYFDNSHDQPGDYNASITSVQVSSNYNDVNVASLPNKSHSWKITKAVIYLYWNETFIQTDPNGIDFEVPKLDSKYDNQLVYEYYADNNGAPDLSNPVDITTVICDEVKKTPYWVKVSVDPAFTNYYELNGSNNPFGFDVGVDKSAVIVKVTNSNTKYNGDPQPVEFNITGGGAAAVSKSDFTVEYSTDNGVTFTANVPTNAGSYLVRFTLNKTGQAITGSNVKPYVIDKADFDTTNVKWLDARQANAEYTAPYTFQYGVTHELTLSSLTIAGVNSNPNEALTVTFDPNNRHLIGTNADTYTARLIYTYNTNNYNEPALPMVNKVSGEFIFTWEIEKAEVDFSVVHWNYNNDFVFTMTDTGAKMFTVALEGLAGGAENLIQFTSASVVSASDVGMYAAEFTINTADPAYGNYIILNEASVVKTLNWSIQARKFTKPARPYEVPFTGSEYDIFDELGFEDWQLYFDATIDDVAADEWDPATYTFVSGSHHVKLQFKPNMNSAVTIGAKDNAYWSDLSKAEYEFDFNITKTKLILNGFTVSKTDKVAPTPQFSGTVNSDLYIIEVKDEAGNIVTSLDWNTYYTATIKVRPGYEDQAVLMQGGKEIQQAEKKFKTPLNPNIIYTQYDVPSLDKTNFEYAGEQTIPVKNFDPSVMEYTEDSDSTLQNGVGSFKLIIRFKPDTDGAWKTQTNVDPDTGYVTLNFTISKAKIKSTTTTATWDDTGALPEFKLPDALTDIVELEYEILDTSNNVITDLTTIEAGKRYKIRAKLTNGYEEHFEFVDSSGQVLADPTTSLSFSFTKNTKVIGAPELPPEQGGNNGNGGGGVSIPDDFPLWQTIVGGISIILAVTFLAFTIKNANKAKKYNDKAKQTKSKSQANVAYASAFGTETLLMGSLGLEARWWSTIALGLLGLALIFFITMLITHHNAKKAELAYENALADAQQAELERQRKEREEAREEERRQREDERRQRDEDMKMMFMMMSGRGGAAPAPASSDGNVEGQPATYNYVPYDNTAEVGQIVTQVVQALLPAIQGMLPAPNDNVSHDHEELVALREQQNRLIEALITDRANHVEHTHVVETTVHAPENHVEDEDEEDWEDVEEEDFYENVDDEGELVPEEPVEEEVAASEVRPKMPSNFRIRLKCSSDKNQVSYVELKNIFNAYKGITFRMSGRVEKIKYHGEVIAIIGIARKSLKLWMALDPNAYDVKHYHQKDASDKPRYAHVPLLVRIGSDRALKRSKELVFALLDKFAVEPKKRYTEKNLQELAYTLKHNALVKVKRPDLLRESIHIHDSAVITNDDALESCLETRYRNFYEVENFAAVSLDVIDSEFLDGQKVTLDKLKKKGIVPEECNGYTITSGERLSKPLYVVADDFTMSAIKMIVLTGGRAVKLVVPENQVR